MPRSSFDRSRGSSRSSLATEAPSESAQLLPVTNNRRSSSDSLDWAIAQASTSDHPTGTSFDDRATYGGASAAHAADKAERDQRGSLDVAFDLAGSVLHPAPLLIAHVFELTGLYIGIPALFIVAALCWFAHGIYAVCLRYTGGSTLNALASGVLPRAWGGQFTSEVLVDLGVLFVSLGRAAVLLSLIANLMVSLARAVAPQIPLLHDLPWVMFGVGFIYAIPPFLFPHHKRQWNSRLVETLQTSSTLFYVIAMLIILARAHHIDWPPVSDDAHHAVPVHRKEAMGISPWGGISILIFCFSSHQSTFAFQRSLKPPKSLLLPTQQQHRNILSRHIRPQRYNFEMVAFSALLASALVCLGWGLVGYLAIPYPHVGPINIFNSLPHDDTWFAFARLLVLTTMLCGFGSVVRPATTAMRRLLQWPLRFYRQQEEAYQRRIRDAESSDDSDSDLDMHMPAATNKDTTRRNKIKALKRTAVLLAWVIATLLALLFGTNNVTLASMVEVIGCIGSAIQAFIVPAIAFIVLFHIRKARSITGLFASQPQTTEAIADGEAADVDGQVDDMLFKKEQQLQQRLSGRRVWQDIGVFGMLVPAGFVVVFRGLYALIST